MVGLSFNFKCWHLEFSSVSYSLKTYHSSSLTGLALLADRDFGISAELMLTADRTCKELTIRDHERQGI